MNKPNTPEQITEKLEHLHMLKLPTEWHYEHLGDVRITDMNTPATFYCHDHWKFTATPRQLLKSSAEGCPCCKECAKENRARNAYLASEAKWRRDELVKQRNLADQQRRKRLLRASGHRFWPWNPKTGEVIKTPK